MPVGAYLAAVTHRQHLGFLAWLDDELNRPSRADHYAMQIAYYLVAMNAKKPESVRFEKFKLPFERPKPPLTREQAASASRARWLGRLGVPVNEVKRT